MPTSTFELPVPDIARWREGNTGTEGVWRFEAAEPGRRVLISALVHGNELCGAWALKGLLEAGVRPQRGTLTLAFCNLEAFDNFDPADPDASRFVDEDMNRQWIDDRLAAGGSRERRRAAALRPFVAEADWLLDLHSMSGPSAPLALTGMQSRNLALTRRLRSPEHVVVDAGHQSGVRMRDYGRFGAADARPEDDALALLIECGQHGELASRTVAMDQCARFLRAAETLDDARIAAALPGWLQPDAPRQWALDVTGAVAARGEDFRFAQAFTGLEVIARAGTVIGWNGGEAVTTPYDDCVLVMPSTQQPKPGVTVVRFARRRALA